MQQIIKSLILFSVLFFSTVVVEHHCRAEEPTQEPASAINTSAGALIGFQYSTLSDINGRIPLGALLEYDPVPNIGLRGGYLWTIGNVGNSGAQTAYTYHLACVFRLTDFYIGPSFGVSTITRFSFSDPALNGTTFSPAHFGVIAGKDFFVRKDVSVGFDGALRFHSASGSQSSFMTFVAGATLKGWFHL